MLKAEWDDWWYKLVIPKQKGLFPLLAYKGEQNSNQGFWLVWSSKMLINYQTKTSAS